MNKPQRDEEIERQIAEYEQKLREQLLREQEFAELAAEQRRKAAPVRLLPMRGCAKAIE